MATLYPGADYRPLGGQTQPLMRAHDIVCLHTMVGSLDGTDVYFRSGGYGGTESHFGVGHDGTVYQWQDLEHTADANLDGNSRVISIETADTGPGFAKWDPNSSNVPAWLPAQLAVLSDLVAWLCDRYDIPCAAIPDSRPGRRGVAYHRLGVDPWRVAGGERWSTSRGKVCPGDLRIAQVPGVIAAAATILRPAPRPDPALREDVAVTPIPLTFLDDTGRPDPAGLNFRAACPAEAAATSQIVDRAFVRWVSYFGSSSFRIVAWDAHGPIGEADPRFDWWQLPDTVRGFTVEGKRAPGAQPSVALLTAPK